MVLADTNPGIGGLGAATRLTLEEFRSLPVPAAAPEPAREAAPGPVSWRSPDRPPPNLGPPPSRLDWRKRRRS